MLFWWNFKLWFPTYNNITTWRISDRSTLIDNIFSNKQEKINFVGILKNEISDHQPVIVNINQTLPANKTNYITIYSNSTESNINFRNDIASKNIYEKLNKDINCNLNENYIILENEITKSMESHLNKKTEKFNRRKHKGDPWITFGILRSVNKKINYITKQKVIQHFLKKESSGLINIKIPCVKQLPKPRNYIILISFPDM